MRQLLIFMILALSLPFIAAIYVNESPDGSISYSDEPTANSKSITPPAVNSISSPSGSTTNASDEGSPISPNTTKQSLTPPQVGPVAAEKAPAGPSTMTTYKVFSIDTPKDQDNITNQPVIGIQFKTDPNLIAGDKIQVYLDGKAVGTPTGNIYQEISNVERGTHTIYAAILNSQNQPIKRTNSITVYVHRNSIITNPINK